jgi:hypothetical protein
MNEVDELLTDPGTRRVLAAWEILLGQVDTALAVSGQDRADPGWLVLTLVLSLARAEPVLLAETTELLARGGFPLFVRDMLHQAVEVLQLALEPGDGD